MIGWEVHVECLRKVRNDTELRSGNLEGRCHLGDPGVEFGIILK
jgi:hypothetical protein